MRNRPGERPAGRAARRQNPTRAQQASAETPPPDLRAFTIDFFRLFGAEVTALDRRKQGPLVARLPEPLAEHFGSQTLGLCFQSVEPGSGHQLVAHGSRTFDRMLAWLERRGALTLRRLPARHTGSEALLGAVRPTNAAITNLRLHEQQEPIVAFHWRITYRADDKREELYTVVLDEQGAPLYGANVTGSLTASLTGNGSGTNGGGTNGGGSKGPPAPPADAAADPFAAWLAESEPLPDEPPGPDGLLPGPKLPPMAHLVRLAESARTFAVYHADLRCVAHEAEILPRLYKTLNRLTTYYGQQIEELRESSDAAGEKRAALEADLERKRAEEVENHRLRVQVDLAGYAVLYRPVALADMTLGDGVREARLRVRLDRHSGDLERPTCHACGQQTEAVALCRSGHLSCDECLQQCATCGDLLCAACGTLACPVCGKQNCDRCGSNCWACGGRACADHISRCPVCGDAVCHACQSECAECGERQCRSHLRADAVLAGEDGRPHLVCMRCAVRCPGCRQYSARTGRCSLSGQRFCTHCLVACSRCGQLVGPGFYARAGEDGPPFCRACVVTCPACGQPAGETLPCATCGVDCCEGCRRRCSVCDGFFCREHSEVAPGCGHILCHHDAQICHIGHEVVCPRCTEACAICEQHACTHHQTPCTWCGRLYCSKCVDTRSGLCITCASLVRYGQRVDLQQEPCAGHADVRALADQYAWRRASNRALTVYLGASALGSVLLIVREQPGGKQVVLSRRMTPRDLVAGAFHL